MINKSNIGEVTIEEKGFRLTIKQKEEPVQQVIASAAPVQPTMLSLRHNSRLRQQHRQWHPQPLQKSPNKQNRQPPIILLRLKAR